MHLAALLHLHNGYRFPAMAALRLRVSVFGGGRLRDGGLGIWSVGAGAWTIKPSDTNTYFLSGTFTVDPPTNYVPKDFRWDLARDAVKTLELF